MKKLTLFLVATLFSALSFAELNPFAYGLTSSLNAEQTELTVNYSLNADATSATFVLLDGDKEILSQALSGTTKGTYTAVTINLNRPDIPLGKKLSWRIDVMGKEVQNPTEHTTKYSFYHPSAVDIDNNPENATFGLILCNEGMQSVVSKTSGYVSAKFGAGIFAFNAAFEPLPNPNGKPGYNGGITFTNGRADNASATAYAPRRIRISDDGRIFVTSLNTDGNYLWEVNPTDMNEWTPVFKGTLNANKELVDAGSNFVAAPNNGFDVKGSGENLRLMMYSVNLPGITAADMKGYRCDEYNLGTATEWTTAPSKNWVNGKYAINYTGTQVEYDNEGGLWIASYRGTASDANPGLVHINADGVEDAKLIWNNVRQAGIRFNKDFTKLVVAGYNGAAKKATVYTISKDANGAPVLTREAVVDMATVGNNLNDFAWDYAGNLYACGNSSEKLVAWAMPRKATDIVSTPCASKYEFTINSAAQMAKASELNPYAYNLTSTFDNTNKVLTINYTLNANANSVDIVIKDGNLELKRIACSGKTRGSYTEVISLASDNLPVNRELSWEVEVKGTSKSDPTQVSTFYSLYCPHGLAIDKNPNSEYFGRILAAEALDAVPATGYISSGQGAGLYVFNPDFSTDGKVFNGGLDFTRKLASKGFQPWRVKISEDGRIFVSSLDLNGVAVWEVSQDLQTWKKFIAGTNNTNDYRIYNSDNVFLAGPNVAMDVQGSGDNLKLLLYSTNKNGIAYNQNGYRLDEYSLTKSMSSFTDVTKIKAITAFNGANITSSTGTKYKYAVAHNLADLIYDGEGGYWFGASRGGNAEQPNLAHVNSQGEQDYYNISNENQGGGGLLIYESSLYGKVLIKGSRTDNGKTTGAFRVYLIGKDASGKPTLTKKWTITSPLGQNHNAFAVDYAENLYIVGNNAEKIVAFALPYDGLVSTPCATKFTFSIEAYTMTTPVNDPAKGSVTGAGVYSPGSSVTITATPAPGHKLLYWSDRSTENPRTITMNKDEAISAYFVKVYDEEPTFAIEKVWEKTNVPASTNNGYQAVGWDGKIYVQNKTAEKIQVFSKEADELVDYASSGTGQQIAVDEAGNLIVFNAYFATSTPSAILIYQNGSTTGKAVTFTLKDPAACHFFSASGDIYSAEGGYVYFYCSGKKAVNRLKITNGAATAADVTTDLVGGSIYSGGTQNHVMVDIFGNLVTHARSNAVNVINVHTNESKAFTLPSIKLGTLGGCSFELGGKELWAYHAGATNYSSEWNIYNMTDGEFMSEDDFYLVDKDATANYAANWLNVQVVDEYTAYIYQFCPLKAAAVWKVSIQRDDLQEYTVTATANDASMGSVTGGGTYYEGASAILTATANSGYRFVNWTKDETILSTEASFTYTVPAENVTIVANFEALPTITYELNGGQYNQYGWENKGDICLALEADYNATYGTSKNWVQEMDGEIQYNINGTWMTEEEAKGQDATVVGFIQNVTYNEANNLTNLIESYMVDKYGWLKDVFEANRTAQSVAGELSEAIYRKELSAFFLCSPAHSSWPASSSHEAMGDVAAFQSYWGQSFPNPTHPNSTVTLNAPYKEGYLFDGWYANSDFSGAKITVVDETTNGTLYAKWLEHRYTRTVTNGDFGTICLPYGSSSYSGAEFYEIAYLELQADGVTPNGIWLDEVTGALEVGKPYIFKATSTLLIVNYEGDEKLNPVTGVAGLTGTFEAIPTTNDILEGNYMINENRFWLCGTGCWLNANRAYIDKDILHSNTTPIAEIPGRRRVSMGAAGENTTTGVNNLTEGGAIAPNVEGTYDVLGRKFTEPNGTGFYIVNGKKVVIVK